MQNAAFSSVFAPTFWRHKFDVVVLICCFFGVILDWVRYAESKSWNGFYQMPAIIIIISIAIEMGKTGFFLFLLLTRVIWQRFPSKRHKINKKCLGKSFRWNQAAHVALLTDSASFVLLLRDSFSALSSFLLPFLLFGLFTWLLVALLFNSNMCEFGILF